MGSSRDTYTRARQVLGMSDKRTVSGEEAAHMMDRIEDLGRPGPKRAPGIDFRILEQDEDDPAGGIIPEGYVEITAPTYVSREALVGALVEAGILPEMQVSGWKPSNVFCVHPQPQALQELADVLEQRLGVKAAAYVEAMLATVAGRGE